MSKKLFYILTSILLFLSGLFTVKIITIGNGDFLGGIIMGIISFLIIYIVYRGYRWVKWFGIVGFLLLAVGTFLSGIENEDYSFFILTIGYLYLTWNLIRVRSIQVVKKEEQIHQPQLPVNSFQSGENLYEYPLLIKRIQALFIDGALLLTTLIIVMILSEESPNAITIRIVMFTVISLLYEPLLTTYASTLGQKVIGIRVRDVKDPSKRISLLNSYARTFVKDLLGWLSFVTIHFNPGHRAIHDLVASSVMVNVK